MCQVYKTKQGSFVRLCQRYLDRHGSPKEAVRGAGKDIRNRVYFTGEPPLELIQHGTLHDGLSQHHYKRRT